MSFLKNLLIKIKNAIQGGDFDFTKISLPKSIFLLATPMILEMVMESLFAIVDIFFVGKLGENAVSVVGLTESVVFLVYAVGMGLSMAGTALIARRIGEKNNKQAGDIAFQLLLVGIFLSLIISITGYFFASDILKIMGGNNNIILEGSNYTKTIFLGNTAILLLFLLNGIFRGAGTAHLAMQTLILSNGLNIFLDPLFIFGIGNWEGFGLQGAAIATTTGRSIGVFFQLYHLFGGKNKLKIGLQNMVIKIQTIWKIFKISINGMGQFMIDSVAWLILTRIVAVFENEAIAAYTILVRILIFSLMPAWGLAGAAATLVGQNLGAQKVKRAEIAVYLTAKYNMIFLIVVSLIYFFGGKYVIGFFTQNQNVMVLAQNGIQIMVLGYIFFAVGMVMIQSFNGAGDTKTPLWINIFIFGGIEIPLAYLLAIPLNLRLNGVFISITISHSLHAIIAYFLFKKGRWKKIKV
jgi:putative MATE family efflux protein